MFVAANIFGAFNSEVFIPYIINTFTQINLLTSHRLIDHILSAFIHITYILIYRKFYT